MVTPIHHHQHIHRSAFIHRIGASPSDHRSTDHPGTIVNHEQEVARHSDTVTNCPAPPKKPNLNIAQAAVL